ncbi:MAG: S24/S26 family peptidase [Ruminococcus sp.]|uniref:S24/S26 family peptidase n=1 Tax=uncultured Ruminococcus sp. TaxID=165186 RepID=UPI001B51856B|nr:S24/S26 family peptidase [uncultured Ruminococcus sp.]MBP5268321.1 S24/S26 family peptidase [Ruminococcus sp.]
MIKTTYEGELERSGKIIFTVRGVSMRPLFHEKTDAIVVKKCDIETLKNLDIVLHTRPSPKGLQYVLHRIVGRKNDGNYIIAGDNCVSFDVVPPQDILGVVDSAHRGNKPIRLEGLRYNLYEKLWCKPYKMRFFVLRFRNRFRSIRKKMRSAVR